MRMKWAAPAVGALALGTASHAAAQSQGVAITPYVGYILPMNDVVEFVNPGLPGYLRVEASGGVQVGVIGELSLSKQFAISAFGSSTLGLTQKGTWHFRNVDFDGDGTADNQDPELGLATTQFGGTFVVRPLGRLPNGAPKIFYVEAGGALNLLQVSEVRGRTGTTAAPSWNSAGPVAVFGGGLTFRVGPRSTLQLFARYHMALSEYESEGLRSWNSIPPADVAQKVNMLFVGAGLRTGR